MFLEGIGSLFPWNAFITVTQYFANRLEKSPFEVRDAERGNIDRHVVALNVATTKRGERAGGKGWRIEERTRGQHR
jgi:hypothetical protein